MEDILIQAQEELSKEFKIKFLNDKVHDMIKEINKFEEKIFSGGSQNGKS